MLRVGIAGGAAAGKSTVAAAFAALGVPAFSADAEAHRLTAPGEPLLAELRAAFGDRVFDGETLDRHALADLVFADAAERRRLERIVHPPIRDALAARIAATDGAYCVIEIPLLSAADRGELVDRVLLVAAPEAVRAVRLAGRPGSDADRARRVIAAQPSADERAALADDVLVNDGGVDALAAAVARLHEHYLDIAARGDPGRPGLRLPAA